jgi:hypothetical protein
MNGHQKITKNKYFSGAIQNDYCIQLAQSDSSGKDGENSS